MLPIFVVIAIVFTARNKVWDFQSFLSFVSTLRFQSAWDTLNSIYSDMKDIISMWSGFSSRFSLLELVKNIWLSLTGGLKGLGLLVKCLFEVIVDLIGNIVSIYSYFFA